MFCLNPDNSYKKWDCEYISEPTFPSLRLLLFAVRVCNASAVKCIYKWTHRTERKNTVYWFTCANRIRNPVLQLYCTSFKVSFTIYFIISLLTQIWLRMTLLQIYSVQVFILNICPNRSLHSRHIIIYVSKSLVCRFLLPCSPPLTSYRLNKWCDFYEN